MGTPLHGVGRRPAVQPVTYILLDIEGTTTSVSFVYDTLFPYFTKYFPAYAAAHRNEPAFCDRLAQVQDIVLREDGRTISTDAAEQVLLDWTVADRKETNLKAMQGEVWRNGYAAGALKGHVYPDVRPALERWTARGLRVGIYSSGSVDAQKLLFGHSEAGDLLPFLSDHFDTHIGPKRAPEAYRAIAEALGLPPSDILFCSDVEAELDAARSAGLQTLQIVRPGTQASGHHPTAPDFSSL